jgi:cytochrome P450
MAATPQIDHHLVAAAFAADVDPWPAWLMLRDAGPVVESGPMFLVTHHAAVKSVFRNPQAFSSNSRRQGSRAAHLRGRLTPERLEAFDEIAEFHSHWMQVNDGDVHRRLRSIAHRAFTPARIARLEQAAVEYVAAEIDRLADEPVTDLKRIATQVPLMIMTDLLGVPPDDRHLIRGWSENWFEYQFVDDDRIFISLQAQRDFRAYVEEMLDRHRRAPDPTDLVSAMVGAHHEERLTPDEVAGMFFMLLFAGHETTANLLGTGLLVLLTHRDQWRLITGHPELAGPALEEALRFASPVQFLHRYTCRDVEVADATIPEGATTTVVLASANRDPAVFDQPDRFDIERADVSQHLAFGFGPHFCLGNSLARMEARVGLVALATRFPDLELAISPSELKWRGGSQLRGLQELPAIPGIQRVAAGAA